MADLYIRFRNILDITRNNVGTLDVRIKVHVVVVVAAAAAAAATAAAAAAAAAAADDDDDDDDDDDVCILINVTNIIWYCFYSCASSISWKKINYPISNILLYYG